jgi:hypothetical protein
VTTFIMDLKKMLRMQLFMPVNLKLLCPRKAGNFYRQSSLHLLSREKQWQASVAKLPISLQ